MENEEQVNEEVNETNQEEVAEQPTSLEDAISEEPMEAKEEAPQEQTETQEKAAEEGEEAETGEEQPAAGDEDLTDEQVAALPQKEQGFYKAMKTERGKRQDLQGQLDEATRVVEDNKLLLQQATELIKGLQQAPTEQKGEEGEQKPASFWDDPEAFIAAAVQGVSTPASTTPPPQVFALSEQMARQSHEDYDDVYPLFVEAAQADPGIAKELLQSANPGEYAYQTAKRLQTAKMVQEAGGLDGYAEKIRAEERAKLEAANTNAAVEEVIEEKLPTSLGSRSTGGGMSGNKAFAGVTSLDEL